MAVKQVEVMPYEAIASLPKAGEQRGQGTSSAKGWELWCSTGGAAEALSVSSGNWEQGYHSHAQSSIWKLFLGKQK